jgi:DNA topoisomerase-1
MPKKYCITPSLVIVESPAKCQKIQQYLGTGYIVMASYGHLRELVSLKDINLANSLELHFSVVDNTIKKRQIANIKKAIKQCDEVILASDSDREGEAIAWHICELFNLDVTKCKRIVFNEITESAIQHAIKNPRTIDINLVYAQQTRQVLDLLVGFKISPVLWKFLTYNAKHSLSAGRCQTPALKLIYDNQLDINNGQERKVYNTCGYFTRSNIGFDLNKQFETDVEITGFLEASIEFKHTYSCSKPTKVTYAPPIPFTTSRLQQIVSNECKYSPKETMKICQSLYEAGYITYMRTDSATYSADFINATKSYIMRNYEDKYVREDIDTLRDHALKDSSSNKTQDAHEAIRPTDISLKELSDPINSKERRVYKIIWETTLESCMSPAIFHSIKASISGAQNTTFHKSSELVYFPGWKIVKHKYEIENSEYQYLHMVPNDTILQYTKIAAKVTIKNLKRHYTEAKLIQLLEEHGIGRPSTYSMLVEKIQEREYVKKEDIKGKEIDCLDYDLIKNDIVETCSKREFGNEQNKLVIQPLGTIVIGFLSKHFLELFNYDYTKNMEDDLDKIATGLKEGYDVCKKCDSCLDLLISNLNCEKKLAFTIDDANKYIVGKYGPVIQCTETVDNVETIIYKPVKNNIDIANLENGTYKIEDLVKDKPDETGILIGNYKEHDVFIKKGRYGLYVMWNQTTKTLKELGKRDLGTITLEEILPYLECSSSVIREISKEMSIRNGTKGHYIFYKNAKMKKPKFCDIKKFNLETGEDYKTCNIDILKSWIKQTYNIE